MQFADDLGAPDWQDVTGTVAFVGDRGYLTEVASAPGQRFYRILLSR